MELEAGKEFARGALVAGAFARTGASLEGSALFEGEGDEDDDGEDGADKALHEVREVEARGRADWWEWRMCTPPRQREEWFRWWRVRAAFESAFSVLRSLV